MTPQLKSLRPLTIAFIYDSFTHYRSLSYSLEECSEFDHDDAIESIIQSFKDCGHRVVPVAGIKELVPLLAEGKHKSWDLAFPTAEGMFGGAGREAQVSGLLEAYQIPHVFSDAATIALSHDKGKTKIILEQAGIPTAPFAIFPAIWPENLNEGTTRPDLKHILENTPHASALKHFPLFIKPACEGSSKGIYTFSKVRNFKELEDGIAELQRRYPEQSILIETFLAGEEHTVSIIGTGSSARAIGTVYLDWAGATNPADFDLPNWDSGVEHDYQAFLVDEKVKPEVKEVEELALRAWRAWRALGCRDVGRVDLRWGGDGRVYVLEINAIPGMRPDWSTLAKTAAYKGMSHREMIAAVLESAVQRYPHLRSKN